MRGTEICLFWLDKNWKSKGEAENAMLLVDYENKMFKHAITYMVPSATAPNSFEIKRKSDLIDYIKLLRQEEFRELPIDGWPPILELELRLERGHGR